MTISAADWDAYIKRLRKINEKAAHEMSLWFKKYGLDDSRLEDLLNFTYAMVSKYGAASSQLAADMYDAAAELSGKYLPPAEIAELPSYSYVSRKMRQALDFSHNIDYIVSAATRFVKQASQDTTLLNCQRDGAQAAWIPHGDTCAFCIMLGSNGWRNISKETFKNGRATHIHPNCDCAYAVRFDETSNVGGYDPDALYDIYRDAYEDAAYDGYEENYSGEGKNYRVNAIRHKLYQQNKEKINAQKRSAYEKRKELNSSEAEETKV